MKPEEFNKHSSTKSRFNWKKIFAKKWFFPAVYVSVTALILSIAWWYQGKQLKDVTLDEYSIGVTDPQDDGLSMEGFLLPVQETSGAEKTTGFYDDAQSDKDKESSLVKYANTYWPHAGCDFARKDGKTFDIISVMDGKVLEVSENPIVGKQIEIQHKDGVVSVYQSLSDVTVEKDQTVQKGLVIAKAGRNTFEKGIGNHLHFEIRKNKTAQNPEHYFSKN